MSSGLTPFVIRFGRLGDTLLLQPLLQKLHARYGRPCRLLAVGKCSTELYDGQPDVESVNALRAHHRSLILSPEQWRAIHELRKSRGGPVYICEPQPRALNKIRKMLRLANVPADHCVFLTDMAWSSDGHWVDRLLSFGDQTPSAFGHVRAHAKGCSGLAPRLTVSHAERSDCDDWLRRRHLDGRPLILLQPANKRTMRWNGVRQSADDDKSWPNASWIATVRLLSDAMPDAHILLCGSPAEASYLDALQKAVANPAVHVAAVDLPVRRLKALLAVAHSMISVDTGPAHLAAAMGCPLVVLFGSVSPLQWAPRGQCADSVCVLGGPPHSHRVDAIAPERVLHGWYNVCAHAFGATQRNVSLGMGDLTRPVARPH